MRALIAVIALAVGLIASGSTAAAVSNYQGMWWKAPAGSESGWGINFAHQGDTIFATWFTFGLDGKPLWLVVAAAATAPNAYSGTLYTGTGPAFNAVPFDPSKVVGTPVGTATFTFADNDNATFAYTVNGVSQTKQITREQFGAPIPTCTWGAQPNLALATNFQDMWWAAPGGTEPGWGVNFAHQGDTIFATWFTFGIDGKPLWLVEAATRTAPNVYSGRLFTGTGPAFDAVPFDPAKVVATEVGTATLTFSDGNNALFAYTLNGISQTRQITREIFRGPGTVCSATPPPAPTATEVGVAAGNSASATIGAAGGSVSAPDGKLVLTIPPGALAVDAAIGIQPITNLAHGKIGAAYRLTPAGQTFLKPVTLAFAYTDQDLLGTAVEVLGAAFQTADGFWQWLGAATIDATAKIVSVRSSHFTDVSSVKGLQIRPQAKTLRPKAGVELHVKLCYFDNSAPDTEELASLGYDCDLDQGPDGILTVDEWSVNGHPGGDGVVGTVHGDNTTATYTAPATVPDPHVVAVSARVHIPGQGGKALVVSNIAIVEESWSGTASGTETSAVIVQTSTASVTWTLDSIVDNVAVYRPTGTVSATIALVGCSNGRLVPSSHALNPASDGRLTIDYNRTPPTYHGSGLSSWSATLACDEGSVPGYEGQTDFFGGSGGSLGIEAAGAVSPDGATIDGSDARPVGGVGQQTFRWTFTRNQ